MDHLPNGKYPVKEVKVFGDNYIFVLLNDLMVHTHAVHLTHAILCNVLDIKDTYQILIVNGESAPIIIYIGIVKITSTNYKVLLTKEDIVEELI